MNSGGGAAVADLFLEGFFALPSEQTMESMPLSFAAPAWDDFKASYKRLVQDRFMGDGGRYRYRRYSRFRLEPGGAEIDWRALPDSSIYQERADNPLNGGVTRTFVPLEAEVIANPFFRALLESDLLRARGWLPELFTAPVHLGVHQVRIRVVAGEEGRPTPEGVHRDAERLTVQHLVGREGITGGEFRVHDRTEAVAFSWLQLQPMDSIAFLGTTWHSATPIQCRDGEVEGYRDILLVDFDPAPMP